MQKLLLLLLSVFVLTSPAFAGWSSNYEDISGHVYRSSLFRIEKICIDNQEYVIGGETIEQVFTLHKYWGVIPKSCNGVYPDFHEGADPKLEDHSEN